MGEGDTMNYIARTVLSSPRSTASGQIDFGDEFGLVAAASLASGALIYPYAKAKRSV
jgi:hypothetical protein